MGMGMGMGIGDGDADNTDYLKQAEKFFKDWFIDEKGSQQRIVKKEITKGIKNPEFEKHFLYLKNHEGRIRDDQLVLQNIKMIVRRAKYHKGTAVNEEEEPIEVKMPERGLPVEFREDFKTVFYGKSRTSLSEVKNICDQNENFRKQWATLLMHKGNDVRKSINTINMFLQCIEKGEKKQPIPEVFRQTIIQKLKDEDVTLSSMKSLADRDEQFKEAWLFMLGRHKSAKETALTVRKIVSNPKKNLKNTKTNIKHKKA